MCQHPECNVKGCLKCQHLYSVLSQAHSWVTFLGYLVPSSVEKCGILVAFTWRFISWGTFSPGNFVMHKQFFLERYVLAH